MVDVVAEGVVRTFLIADVRGYTRFTVDQGDAAATRLAGRFAEICRDVVRDGGGEVTELRGDEALAVFTSTRSALLVASALQHRFIEETQADPSTPLRVGIGLDAGEAIPFDGGYRGAALNLAARLCSLAGPGEVLVSEAVTHLARRVEGLEYVDRAQAELKGFAEPVHVFAVQRSEMQELSAEAGDADPPDEPPSLPIGGFLGSLPSTPLVAREEEYARVLESIDAVTRSEGRLVMLAGEPGVGKTRLAQEATLHLRNAGFVIAAGSCFEARQTVPYYPFLDAVAALYGAASPSTRAQVSDRWAPLAHLLPEAGLPLMPGTSRDEDQERTFRAVTGFTTAVAAERPVAILLDDLHWADRASLDLLQHLTRHTRGNRVLILGTYRDVEVGRQHPLEGALLELGRHGLVERIPVRRLDRQGTVALMEAQFNEEISDELSRLIYDNTEGNPFFTYEVLRALIDRGDIYRENGRWERVEVSDIQVPESVRAAIGQRLSRLEPETQEILRQASVFGQRFHFDDLLAVVDGTEDELEAALESASGAGLVRDVGGDLYAFEHALTQQALYGELSPRRRRRMHLAVGEALEGAAEKKGTRRASPRAVELAWHFLQADDERALPYAISAGDEAEAVFARGEAEAQYRVALELAQEQEDRMREAEALGKLARTLYAVAQYEEGTEIADRAVTACRAVGDAEGERRATATFARCCGQIGRQEEGMARLDALLGQHLPPSAGAIDLHQARLLLLFASARFDELAAEALTVRTLGESLGDEAAVAHAAMSYGLALQTTGKVRESVPVFEQAVPLAAKLHNSTLLATTLHNLADGYRMLGRFALALSNQERALDVHSRSAEPARAGFALAWLGHFQTLLGRWNEARATCERGVAIFAEIGDSSWFAAYPLLYLGALDQMEGRPEAEDRLRRAFEMAERRGDGQALSELLIPLTQAAMLRLAPQQALELVERVIAERNSTAEAVWLPAFRIYRAWALAEVGDAEAAVRTLEADLSTPVLGLPFYRVDALRVLGAARRSLGAFDAAHAAFEEGLEFARPMPYPFAEGFLLYEYGVMEQERGRGEIASTHLRDALACFESLGAEPYARLARERLNG